MTGSLGRWLSPDTLVPQPENPQSLNRYSYVGNRPLTATDPTGHYSQDIHEVFTRQYVYQAMLQQGRRYGLGAEARASLATSVSEQVSAADQGVDCPACSDSSAKKSGVLHWMSHREAKENMADAVQSGDPVEFGRSLHAVQDSYSHFGQGFEGLDTKEVGQGLYETRRLEDDIDPSAHGGLELEIRRENAKQWGHSGASARHRWQGPILTSSVGTMSGIEP